MHIKVHEKVIKFKNTLHKDVEFSLYDSANVIIDTFSATPKYIDVFQQALITLFE
jgi:hypothetical protein